MRVQLLGYTIAVTETLDEMFGARQNPLDRGIDLIVEGAGRNCYQSWDKPNPETANNKGYIKNIINHEHFSVMEHGHMALRVTEPSRSLLIELERHRHLSFSVLSQRFVHPDKMATVIHPAVEELPEPQRTTVKEHMTTVADMTRSAYTLIRRAAVEAGVKGKKASEIARMVLPNMMGSDMVVSGNIRAWRDFLSKRYTEHADREAYEFSRHVLVYLRQVAPNCVQDFE